MTRFWLGFLAGIACIVLIAVVALAVRWMMHRASGPDARIVYRETAQGALHLDIFRARDATAPAPALLLFHGGAWQYGGPGAFHPQCREFSRRGVACISVEYRIASRHGTDARAALQDARAAFAYVLEQAGQLGVDAARIHVGGGSAGGQLAAAVGVGVPLPSEPAGIAAGRPAGLVLYNPMLDLSPCTPDHHLVADFWEQLSPLHHVNGDVADTLILLGTEDREVPVPVARAFCEAMTAHGNRCDLALYEGASHGFFNRSVAAGRYFDATNARVLDFIRRDPADGG